MSDYLFRMVQRATGLNSLPAVHPPRAIHWITNTGISATPVPAQRSRLTPPTKPAKLTPAKKAAVTTPVVFPIDRENLTPGAGLWDLPEETSTVVPREEPNANGNPDVSEDQPRPITDATVHASFSARGLVRAQLNPAQEFPI